MAEGISKYTFQENFTIGYNEIFGNFSTAVAGNNPIITYQSIPLGGSIYNFQQIGNNLVCYFDINLNPINNNVKTLSIKYINSCLTSAGGYLFQLSCPQLFRTPVQFVDGSSSFGVHTEYLNQPLPTNKARFTLTMISGPKPSVLNDGTNYPNPNYNVPGTPYNNQQNYAVNNNTVWVNDPADLIYTLEFVDFVTNPGFGFALEYAFF